MPPRFSSLLLASWLGSLPACSMPDASFDALPDASPDISDDGHAGSAGSAHSDIDSSADATPDSHADADTEASIDAPQDATPDAPQEAATDAPQDAPPDAPHDASPDVPQEAATDAPQEANVDAGPCTGVPNYAATILADGPVAYWRLGETLGFSAVDATGNGHDGTYFNTDLGVPGALTCDTDTAARFTQSKNSYVTVLRHVALEPASSLTVELWFNQSAGKATQYEKLLWYGRPDKQPWGSYGFERISALQDGFTFFAHTSTSSFADALGLAENTWHHLVGTYNGAQLVTFVNGVATDQIALTGSILYDQVHGLVIGAADSNFDNFDGLLDEVAIYAKVLTQQQVLAHYKAGRP